MAIKQLLNEKELLQNIAEGDQTAFTTLFNHYHKYVFAFGKKITYSEELAEEIVQDIFLKLWLKRERLAQIDNFGAYLNRTIQNHSFNVLRQLAQGKKLDSKLNAEPIVLEFSTDRMIDYKETLNILKEALSALSPQQRTAYTLCHQEGLKYVEAAEQMNISPQTIHEYMKIALAKIRAHFKKNGVAYQMLMVCLFHATF